MIGMFIEHCPFCGSEYFVKVGFPSCEDFPMVYAHTPSLCQHLEGNVRRGKQFSLVFRDGARIRKVKLKNMAEIDREIEDRMVLVPASWYGVEGEDELQA